MKPFFSLAEFSLIHDYLINPEIASHPLLPDCHRRRASPIFGLGIPVAGSLASQPQRARQGGLAGIVCRTVCHLCRRARPGKGCQDLCYDERRPAASGSWGPSSGILRILGSRL